MPPELPAQLRNPARSAQALLHILSRQAPALSSRWMEFHLDDQSFG